MFVLGRKLHIDEARERTNTAILDNSDQPPIAVAIVQQNHSVALGCIGLPFNRSDKCVERIDEFEVNVLIFNRGRARYSVHHVIVQVVPVHVSFVGGADAAILGHRERILLLLFLALLLLALLRHPVVSATSQVVVIHLLTGMDNVLFVAGEARVLGVVLGLLVGDLAQVRGLMGGGARGAGGGVVFSRGRVVILEVDRVGSHNRRSRHGERPGGLSCLPCWWLVTGRWEEDDDEEAEADSWLPGTEVGVPICLL
jgi:hypothetical protein